MRSLDSVDELRRPGVWFSLDLPGDSHCVEKMASVDASGFLLFFRDLSQLYQGLGPIDSPSYFEPKAIEFSEPLKVLSDLPPFQLIGLTGGRWNSSRSG